mgnify:FL=1
MIIRLALLWPLMLLISPIQSSAGDLGAADMNINERRYRIGVFEGKCGGPLSDTLVRCRVSFVDGKLVLSTDFEADKDDLIQFEETRGIYPDQVRHISWKENGSVYTEKGYGFVNEIIYESSSGAMNRAGFTFRHGDQVRGFYPALLEWLGNPIGRAEVSTTGSETTIL